MAGFEVDLLEKWTIHRSGVFIDVWPCGTRNSFFGVSDAIGRSRPIAVLEDRDFRTPAQAAESCDKLARDRRERQVEVKYWRAWRRNEIENYLIEPEVLTLVLAARFAIPVVSVSERLQQVIAACAADQAAQKAIDRFRTLISGHHPSRYIFGLPRKTHRPTVQRTGVAVPTLESVARKLREEFDAKRNCLAGDSKDFDKKIGPPPPSV